MRKIIMPFINVAAPIFLVWFFLCVVMPSVDAEPTTEKDYQTIAVDYFGGQPEYRVDSYGSRSDIYAPPFVYEVEWAPKWQEAVGQVLYYAAMTYQQAVIILIMADESDYRYLDRLLLAISDLDIEVFTIDPSGKVVKKGVYDDE